MIESFAIEGIIYQVFVAGHLPSGKRLHNYGKITMFNG